MREAPSVAAAFAVVLAGCTGAVVDAPSGARDVLFGPPVAVSLEYPGAEPVIAVASDGTIFIEGVGTSEATNTNNVWRSIDDGATWQDVTPAGLGGAESFDGFLAIGNGDAIYFQNVAAGTFQLWRSDDLGDSWTQLATPRVPAAMHRNWIVPVGESTVHVVVEALPPTFATESVSPQAPGQGMWYFRSDDRGTTWSVPEQIDPIVNFAGQGNLVVSEDGDRLYVLRYEEPFPQRYESGLWYLMASEDGGATWERRDAFPLTSELASAVMPLAMDPAGTIFMTWAQERNGTSVLLYAFTKDGGASWSAPREVAPRPGTQSMVWIDARGVDEIGVLWYAADAHGTAAAVDATWFVDYALLTAASTGAPVRSWTRVTPEGVHAGNVCAKGPACAEGEDRSLLDYPWIDFDAEGRPHLAFASTNWDKPSAFPMYAGPAFATGSSTGP